MATQAIWIQKSFEGGYSVWTDDMPSYDIPNNRSLDEALDYFRANKEEWEAKDWFSGTGTHLGYLVSDKKNRLLCKLNDMAELI